MKTAIQRFVSMAVRMSTQSGAHRFPHILLFSFLAVCPTVAHADCGASGDIPFTVTLTRPLFSDSVGCLYVQGPWGRTNSPTSLRDLTVGQPCTFYAADDSILSPFGSWRVVIDRYCVPGLPSGIGTRIAGRFSLEKSNINQVNIKVTPHVGNRYDITVSRPGNGTVEALAETVEQAQAPSEVSVNAETAEQAQAPSPKKVSVDAWLGDSHDASGRPDVFFFKGTAGDSVTVRLEADTQRGNNGGDATLRFGGPPARQVTGKLPQEITVQLGSTGNYEIVIEQSEGQGVGRYRGGYILTVESSLGNIKALVPTDSVEK